MKQSILSIGSYLTILCILFSCNTDHVVESDAVNLFTNIPVTESKLNFRNPIQESSTFNFMTYYYIYNGGGVAIGDINNDGLDDIFFTANQGSDKLYLNKGKMRFEDVTSQYGLVGDRGWSTGVSMIDINADGWLDIYVCRSGSTDIKQRQNKLFINEEGQSFKESALEYGLADPAYSTQAYFFDYDKDDDLDMFLVNHRSDFNNAIVYNAATDAQTDIFTSDKLYRNNNGRFTDVSEVAGVANRRFGLSASIYDFNNDGWDDIYVCNDFIQGDHLWINDRQGGFRDEIHQILDHTPFFSMGSDVADINNDQLADLIALDMVSEDHISNKRNMAGMSTSQFFKLVELGNHYQYMTNVLQLNRNNGVFSDIAYSAGVANTDWSWAPLLADFDNDGFKDLFVTNGIKRDMTDNDFKIAFEKKSATGSMSMDELFEMIPSRKIRNYFFINKGNTVFEDKSSLYGLDQNLNSNGAAYGDLDNDGDLDLVVNNLDDYASLYQNNAAFNYIKIKLKGSKLNPSGIGASIYHEDDNGKQFIQNYHSRGFQSSVSNKIIFGIGNNKKANITIVWPDGKTQTLHDVKSNSSITLEYKNAGDKAFIPNKSSPILKKNSKLSRSLAYKHDESEYDDFSSEILLPQKYSTLGPSSASADINNDGLEDFLITGAIGQATQLYFQKPDGEFELANVKAFELDKDYEGVNAIFIDGDDDGDQDLYVVSGGNEYPIGSPYYQDNYYQNNGKGDFTKANEIIPEISFSGYAITSGDYDSDGDIDLFVGGRIVPGRYPLPSASILLRNEGGKFIDTGDTEIKGIDKLGMISDALFTDFDADSDLDLMFIGEWMGARIFENTGNSFVLQNLEELTGRGWWYSITEGEFNGDGKPDYLLGNLGLNNKFGANKEKVFHVFCDDFDASGNLDIVLSKEKKGELLPVRGRECSSQQMPFIKEKFPTFKSFAESNLIDIYGKENIENALHYTVNNFKSIVLLSNQNDGFSIQDMPIELQYGPVLSAVVVDINKDGKQDIIAAGNIYNAEVETVRYDASKGIVLLGDGQGGFGVREDSGLLLDGNVKQIKILDINKQKKLLVVKNNEVAEFYDL